jgi:hypothetical protein
MAANEPKRECNKPAAKTSLATETKREADRQTERKKKLKP